jgi:alpha-tubulin suppressor-like RCC1 family protein
MKVLRKVLSGNENVYLYNPVLRELAEIRKASIMQMQSGGMMG